METDKRTNRKADHGHNMKRFREAMGIKQDTLARDLNVSQQTISRLEGKKEFDDETLQRVAKALNISPQLIEELEEDPVNVVIENNTFENGSNNNINGDNNDSNRHYYSGQDVIALCKENASLYERMLAIERERIALLEELLKEKKD